MHRYSNKILRFILGSNRDKQIHFPRIHIHLYLISGQHIDGLCSRVDTCCNAESRRLVDYQPGHHQRARLCRQTGPCQWTLMEAHASSNPGELGRQDWSPRSIRHHKHTPCGRSRFYHAFIVVFIAAACELPALSIRRSVLTPLPRLYLVLVHTVATLLCYVSSSTYQPKPPALLIVCFLLAIAVLISRFRGLVDCVCVSCPPFFKAPRFALRGGWDT